MRKRRTFAWQYTCHKCLQAKRPHLIIVKRRFQQIGSWPIKCPACGAICEVGAKLAWYGSFYKAANLNKIIGRKLYSLQELVC